MLGLDKRDRLSSLAFPHHVSSGSFDRDQIYTRLLISHLDFAFVLVCITLIVGLCRLCNCNNESAKKGSVDVWKHLWTTLFLNRSFITCVLTLKNCAKDFQYIWIDLFRSCIFPVMLTKNNHEFSPSNQVIIQFLRNLEQARNSKLGSGCHDLNIITINLFCWIRLLQHHNKLLFHKIHTEW